MVVVKGHFIPESHLAKGFFEKGNKPGAEIHCVPFHNVVKKMVKYVPVEGK